jgi:hypothetical protein
VVVEKCGGLLRGNMVIHIEMWWFIERMWWFIGGRWQFLVREYGDSR